MKLVHLCEYKIANHFTYLLQTQSLTIAVLPVNLKARLLRLLTHRGLISDENLALILNCRTRTFDFRDCADISDQSLLLMAGCSLNAQIERKRLQSTQNELLQSPIITSSVLNPSIVFICGEKFTDRGLIPFVRQYPSLRKLRAHNCLNLTDECLFAIGQSCMRLMELDLTGCVQITDRGIEALSNLTNLRCLALARTNITDKSLISIGQSAFHHALNEINLRMCTEITDDGFLYLLKSCLNLKTIGFTQCPKLTERSRQNLNSQTHQLSYLVWSIPV